MGYASLCNSIGQSFGVFLANQGYIALSDSLFCKQFLYMPDGKVILTLETFMLFWGVVFIVVTCAVWIGKKEGKSSSTPTTTTVNSQINNTTTSLSVNALPIGGNNKTNSPVSDSSESHPGQLTWRSCDTDDTTSIAKQISNNNGNT